eukprot:4661986-Prymnesium_polylepis.1
MQWLLNAKPVGTAVAIAAANSHGIGKQSCSSVTSMQSQRPIAREQEATHALGHNVTPLGGPRCALGPGRDVCRAHIHAHKQRVPRADKTRPAHTSKAKAPLSVQMFQPHPRAHLQHACALSRWPTIADCTAHPQRQHMPQAAMRLL